METVMASPRPRDPPGRAFHISLPNTASGASHARKRFVGFIASFDFAAELVADIELAVGEALANAAEHGYKHDGIICLQASLTSEYLEVSVSDDGRRWLKNENFGMTARPCGFESVSERLRWDLAFRVRNRRAVHYCRYEYAGRAS
jgi:anti-sigma regulatory factor (Ser/Thr protein kinase)